MSSHVLPPPVPELEEGLDRPKLWVIEDEQELDVSEVSEVGSSLTSAHIRTRYVDPTALDAAAALSGVPTGDSISRGSFSDGSSGGGKEQLLGNLFQLNGDAADSYYGGSGSNLLRESNRVNTAQMVASVRFVRRRRIQNMILGCSAAASLAVVLTMFMV